MKNIVFVLGAGASKDIYSSDPADPKERITSFFPTGAELKSNIISGGYLNDLNSDNKNPRGASLKRHQKFKDLGFTPMLGKDFYEIIVNSRKNSVDFILNEFPEFNDLGKFLIALHLIEKEREFLKQCINPNKEINGWYNFLLEEDILSPKRLEEFKFTFITFNYERSLEIFLNRFYPYTYNRSIKSKSVAYYLNKIEFEHIHGSLGEFNFGDKPPMLNTRSPSCWDSVKESSEKIKTIHDQGQNERFSRARSILDRADKVYTLGFGYNAENTELLFHKKIKANCYGTAYGMTDEEISIANARCNNSFKSNSHHEMPLSQLNEINIVACNIIELFREYYPIFEFENNYDYYRINRD